MPGQWTWDVIELLFLLSGRKGVPPLHLEVEGAVQRADGPTESQGEFLTTVQSPPGCLAAQQAPTGLKVLGGIQLLHCGAEDLKSPGGPAGAAEVFHQKGVLSCF